MVKHPEYKDPDEKPIYIPQLLFGELLTSANYNKKDKTTGGKNGYGAKLANIFSKEFSVKTLDHKRKKEWTQTFSNNMWTMNKPIIKKYVPILISSRLIFGIANCFDISLNLTIGPATS